MMSKDSSNSNIVVVRFKYKDKDSVHVKRLSHEQYEILKQTSKIEYCELVN